MRKLLAVACLLLDPSALIAGEPLLWRHRVNGEPAPLFIAATDLAGPDGTYSAAFPQRWRESIERERQIQAEARAAEPAPPVSDDDPCSAGWSREVDMEYPMSNKAGVPLAVTAKAVFRGRVSGVIPGLFDGSEGSLIELSEISFVKYDLAYNNMRERAYVRHPHARFAIGSLKFCSEPSMYVPNIGDLMLVYAFDPPSDRDGKFIFTLARDFVVESADGRMHVPSDLRSQIGDALTIDAATERIRKTLVRRRGHAE